MTSAFDLHEFAVGMIGPAGESSLVAMLFGYFDESGTDGTSPHTAIAGFFGPLSDWCAIMGEWGAEIDREGVRPFHRAECKARRGPYWNWAEDRAIKHIDRLSGIAASSPLIPVSATFTGDWACVADTPELKVRFPHAYHLCFELLIANILDQARNHYPGDNSIMLVFERQDQFSSRAQQIYDTFKFNGRWEQVRHFSYGDKKDVPYLQIADLFAWEIRRYFWAQAKADVNDRDFPLIRRLMGRDGYADGYLGNYLDVEGARQSLRTPIANLTFPPGVIWS